MANYEILKEFLLIFAKTKLPSAEDQKVLGQPQCCGSMGSHVSQKKGYIRYIKFISKKINKQTNLNVCVYIIIILYIGPMLLGEDIFPHPRQLLPYLQ